MENTTENQITISKARYEELLRMETSLENIQGFANANLSDLERYTELSDTFSYALQEEIRGMVEEEKEMMRINNIKDDIMLVRVVYQTIANLVNNPLDAPMVEADGSYEEGYFIYEKSDLKKIKATFKKKKREINSLGMEAYKFFLENL